MKLRTFVIAVVAAVTVGAGALGGAPAGAQQGDGIVTLEASHPAGTSVHFIVRVTWADDGHPATNAVVTATAVGSDGTQLAPVTLAPIDDDGRYANAIDFGSPGSWTVRFTSVDPTGAAEVTQTIEATAGDGGTASGDSGEGGFAPADDDTGASGEASSSDSGDSGMPLWLIGAAAVVALGGGLLGLRTVRRYRSEAAREDAQFEELEATRTAGGASDARGGTPQGPKAEA
jgi:hypothetical protein